MCLEQVILVGMCLFMRTLISELSMSQFSEQSGKVGHSRRKSVGNVSCQISCWVCPLCQIEIPSLISFYLCLV